MNVVIELSEAVATASGYSRTAVIGNVSETGRGSNKYVAAERAIRALLERLDQEAPAVVPQVSPPAPTPQVATPAAPQRNEHGYLVDPNDLRSKFVGKRVTTDYGYAKGKQGLGLGLSNSPDYVMVRWDGSNKVHAENPRFLKIVE